LAQGEGEGLPLGDTWTQALHQESPPLQGQRHR